MIFLIILLIVCLVLLYSNDYTNVSTFATNMGSTEHFDHNINMYTAYGGNNDSRSNGVALSQHVSYDMSKQSSEFEQQQYNRSSESENSSEYSQLSESENSSEHNNNQSNESENSSEYNQHMDSNNINPIMYDKISSNFAINNEETEETHNNYSEETDNSQFESEGEICDGSKITTCDADKCGLSNLHPILDPRYNMREAAKQCLLLEDHLNNIKKRCYDCIRKHFLIIDGLLEEAVSLEKSNNDREYYRKLHHEWIKIQKNYAKNSTDSNNLDNISKSIRFFRKPLVEKYFDTISEYNDT
jgi:hypothetical protein